MITSTAMSYITKSESSSGCGIYMDPDDERRGRHSSFSGGRWGTKNAQPNGMGVVAQFSGSAGSSKARTCCGHPDRGLSQSN
jgi:hypothetical protein